MEVRYCLVTDILLNIRKSAEWIWKRWYSTVYLWGSGEMSLFPKKVDYPFKFYLKAKL